jgi:steroid delta-isomerase-like uncharacterized protein
VTPDVVVRTWFDEVWNRGNESAIDRLLAPDAIAHGLPGGGGQPLRGPEAFKPFVRSFRSAFPDIQVVVERTVTEGNMVCAHCHVTATHRGDGMGVAPTGERIVFSGMTISRVENDRIHEAWNSFDFMSMFQQIRMLPQLASAQKAH